MSKIDVTVLIIDDTLPSNDPLKVKLEGIFNNVVLKTTPQAGLEYILTNQDKKIVILLDYKFPRNEPNGDEILKKIREISKNIPVVIWTANKDIIDEFPTLINNQAYALIDKIDEDGSIEKLKSAANQLIKSIDKALEEWLLTHSSDERKSTKFISLGGKTLSLEDLLVEVKNQTEIGTEFEKKLLKLTIDLISRNRENI